MSLWLVSVPAGKNGGSALHDIASHTGGSAQSWSFDIPPLKVGTLDQLMQLSEDTTKMDTIVGGVAKKIEKTYYEMWKTEAQEAAAQREKEKGASSSSSRTEEKAPELRIGDNNKTSHEFVTSWQWNDVRYPRRSALRLLSDIIIKDASKADESLKKQVAEYNEVRTSYTTIDRKDQGSLLVKPIGQYVKQAPVETNALTTLMIVVPKARQQEFMESYELMEQQNAVKEEEDAKRRQAESEERAKKEAERARQLEAEAALANANKTPEQLAHEQQRMKEKQIEKEKQEEARKVEASMQDKEKDKQEQLRKSQEEEEKKKPKKLPKGVFAVVPRSATILCNEPSDEFILVSVVVLKAGAEHFKNLCREKRFTVRPFKYDPEEDRLERERKVALAQKKKQLWNFLIRWCTTTYTEVFTAWLHLKAIRLYVEAVLRYGLPYNAQAVLLEPGRGKEKAVRETLAQMYAKLAGNNANLTSQLDPNEPDLSGLGQDFYPYVYLPLQLGD